MTRFDDSDSQDKGLTQYFRAHEKGKRVRREVLFYFLCELPPGGEKTEFLETFDYSVLTFKLTIEVSL